MIAITLDLDAGTAKLNTPTTIKAGGWEPVLITLSRDPGGPITFQLALGPQSSTQAVLAYLETFEAKTTLQYGGMIDLTDTRLANHLSGKQTASLDGELAWLLDGKLQVAPNFSVTAQPRMVQGPESSDGGPVYLTQEQVAATIAAALASYSEGLFSGDIIIGETPATFENGRLKSIA